MFALGARRESHVMAANAWTPNIAWQRPLELLTCPAAPFSSWGHKPEAQCPAPRGAADAFTFSTLSA